MNKNSVVSRLLDIDLELSSVDLDPQVNHVIAMMRAVDTHEPRDDRMAATLGVLLDELMDQQEALRRPRQAIALLMRELREANGD